MKLTGPACTETLNEAEEAERRERAEHNAGGVRVERRVRCMGYSIVILQPGSDFFSAALAGSEILEHLDR